MGAEMSQFKNSKQFPEMESANDMLIKSRAHFSDYSMFPDRFNNSAPKQILSTSTGSNGNGTHHFSDYSLYPDKFDKGSSSVPAMGAIQIPRYNFRLRRNSESSEMDDTIETDPPRSGRARSLSNSKLYYFDFSLIPDKDPHHAQDEKAKNLQVPGLRIVEEEHFSAPAQDSTLEATFANKKRVRKTSEPRFGFFDYSMIPDKDPRCFAKKKIATDSVTKD